jgi:hypothetical protein
MITIDFQKKPLDLDGKPFDGEPTLGTVATRALLAPTPPGPRGETVTLPGDQLVKLYAFAQRIHAAKEPMEVSPEELVLLRDKIATAYQNPAVVGPCFGLLSGE